MKSCWKIEEDEKLLPLYEKHSSGCLPGTDDQRQSRYHVMTGFAIPCNLLAGAVAAEFQQQQTLPPNAKLALQFGAYWVVLCSYTTNEVLLKDHTCGITWENTSNAELICCQFLCQYQMWVLLPLESKVTCSVCCNTCLSFGLLFRTSVFKLPRLPNDDGSSCSILSVSIHMRKMFVSW